MATNKKARMRVSLEMLTANLRLPSGIQVVGVEAADDPAFPATVNFVLAGDQLPDTEFVEGIWKRVVFDDIKFVRFEETIGR